MKFLHNDLSPWLALMLRRRQRFLVGALLVWVTLLAGLALLGLSGWFIAACALAGIALAAGLPSSLDIYVPGGGIRFFALLRTVARYTERLYNHNTVLTLLADLRYRVFGDLTRLDDASLRRRRVGEWLSRLTSDIDALDSLYLRLLVPPVVALLSVWIVAGFIAIWLPLVGAVVACVLTLLWLVITLGFARLGFTNSHRQVNDQEELRRLVLDQVQASAELMSYRTSDWYHRKIRAHEQQALDNQRQLAVKAALGNALLMAVTGLLIIGVLWLGSLALAEQRVVGPIMVMAVIAVFGINEVLASLPAAFVRFGASHGAAQRLNALQATQGQTRVGSLPDDEGGHALQLREVMFRYPDAAGWAICQVSLTLPAGQRGAIMGISGSGKSTLANLIMGRISPTEGDVWVAEHAPSAVTLESSAAHMGYLPQQIDLFDGSLADNLRIAKPDATDEELWQVLAQVALSDWAKRQPRQLVAQVGERGQQLSGGQARRVALARLFLRSPSVVLLDEPFAGVDAATARHVAASLDAWLVGRTAIFFVHQVDDAALVPGLAHQWRLDGGKLIHDTSF